MTSALDPMFWRAERLGVPSAWWLHVPFGQWVASAARPRVLVELGTRRGISYASFCQAIRLSALDTRCYAVDTWKGDQHTGLYGEDSFEEFSRFHDANYGMFSSLLRMTFDEAAEQFGDGTVDFLHVDGLHTYEAVRHDFERWRPKLSRRAVVLFHDTNERKGDFGVWRLWAELSSQFPNFEFLHGHGLGVLGFGDQIESPIMTLCRLSEASMIAAMRERFAALGERCLAQTREILLTVDFNQQLAKYVAEKESAEARAAHAQELLRQANAKLLQAQSELNEANARTNAFSSSRIWKAARSLRSAGEKLPSGIRQAIRGANRPSK